MKKALIEISKKNLFIKLFFAFILIFFYTNLNASENKILIKIDNQIITSLDVENEKRLLIVLNPRIKDLEESQIFKIAKNSIIRQKIKKIEILKYTDELKIDDTFLNKLIKSNYSRIGINNVTITIQ